MCSDHRQFLTIFVFVHFLFVSLSRPFSAVISIVFSSLTCRVLSFSSCFFVFAFSLSSLQRKELKDQITLHEGEEGQRAHRSTRGLVRRRTEEKKAQEENTRATRWQIQKYCTREWSVSETNQIDSLRELCGQAKIMVLENLTTYCKKQSVNG